MSIIKHKFFNTLYLYIVRKLEMQITKFWSSSIKFNKAMLWIYFTIMFYIKIFVNPNCKSKSIVKSPDVVNRLTKYIPKSFNNHSRTSSTLLDMSNNRWHVFKNRNTCTQMYLYKYTESGNERISQVILKHQQERITVYKYVIC